MSQFIEENSRDIEAISIGRKLIDEVNKYAEDTYGAEIIYNNADSSMIDMNLTDCENKKNINKFIKEIFPDDEIRNNFLTKYAKIMLTNDDNDKQIDVWVGNGSNGKTMLFKLLQNSFPEIVGNSSSEFFKNSIENDEDEDDDVPELISDLPEKLNEELNIIKNISPSIYNKTGNLEFLEPTSSSFNSNNIKELSGGDALCAKDYNVNFVSSSMELDFF